MAQGQAAPSGEGCAQPPRFGRSDKRATEGSDFARAKPGLGPWSGSAKRSRSGIRPALASGTLKIHISGVCGTATASLCGLLIAKGHEVTGSDQDVYPPMSDELARMGVSVKTPYAERNLPDEADLVVIGNALSRGNPEVEAVLDAKRRYTSQAALLAEEFLRDRVSIVVAGTHGKTTTTSMLTHVLRHAGLDPSFLIGGVSLDLGASYGLGSGRHFVVEGDEYDTAFFDKRPKFVHYLPDIAIIGNLEFDHADIYPDLAAVQLAFSRFMTVVPRRGLIIAGVESPALVEILPRAKSRIATFGIGEEAGALWQARNLALLSKGSEFDVVRGGDNLGRVAMGASGKHNMRNALAATIAALEAGVPFEKVAAALLSFRGVKRRLELRGQVRGVSVYDDFAHHPTAVRETVAALRSRIDASERVVVVFEPRSYTSRTKVFERDFAIAFATADEVVVSTAHLPGKVPEALRISEETMVASINREGGTARFIPTVDEIVADLVERLRPRDHVLVLSNGGFGGIHDRLLTALAS
jgi:UDP-N-acetylmuramate: L-alanyl-gamma-D-glutamyl-meso-diaminopimelate ligase